MASCPSAPIASADAADTFAGPFLQVARTYLLRAVADGFEIVDQHALHERLTYEELRRDVAAGTVEVQRLLVPEPVDVGPAQARLLETHADALARIYEGFDAERAVNTTGLETVQNSKPPE